MKYMTATRALTGRILKIFIQLIWNIASLFGGQTVVVSCHYRQQICTAYLVGFTRQKN